MLEAKKASFIFSKFYVPNFEFRASENPAKNLNLKFDVKGIYVPKEGRFDVEFYFTGYEGENDENFVVKVRSVSVFKFEDNPTIENIPDYFYRNALGIIFPFMRAFVSTLTLQANVKLVKLELMNLSSLEKPFRENIRIIED